MRYLYIGLAAAIAAISAACGQPQPTPTPDIEATVRARVRATTEALSTPASPEVTRSTPTLTPTATPTPTPTFVPTPTSTPSPTATPTLTPTPTIRLQDQLPRNVYEAFYDTFYSGCFEPPFEDLKVLKTWSGESNTDIEFTPSNGTYYLVVVGTPQQSQWSFDSVRETAQGRKFQSLHIDSSAPDDRTDAQQWCTTGFGIILPDHLHVEATNVAWTVYLISPQGAEAVPQLVAGALTGYYEACPGVPPIGDLGIL